MLDNMIIKPLECCGEIDGKYCNTCAYQHENECVISLSRNALDLINRQKAEIESLNEKEQVLIFQLYEERKKAIKEFAERLKKSAFDCDVSFGFGKEHYTKVVTVIEIDDLVKEMVGDKR
jgi:hypothetical protein